MVSIKSFIPKESLDEAVLDYMQKAGLDETELADRCGFASSVITAMGPRSNHYLRSIEGFASPAVGMFPIIVIGKDGTMSELTQRLLRKTSTDWRIGYVANEIRYRMDEDDRDRLVKCAGISMSTYYEFMNSGHSELSTAVALADVVGLEFRYLVDPYSINDRLCIDTSNLFKRGIRKLASLEEENILDPNSYFNTLENYAEQEGLLPVMFFNGNMPTYLSLCKAMGNEIDNFVGKELETIRLVRRSKGLPDSPLDMAMLMGRESQSTYMAYRLGRSIPRVSAFIEKIGDTVPVLFADPDEIVKRFASIVVPTQYRDLDEVHLGREKLHYYFDAVSPDAYPLIFSAQLPNGKEYVFIPEMDEKPRDYLKRVVAERVVSEGIIFDGGWSSEKVQRKSLLRYARNAGYNPGTLDQLSDICDVLDLTVYYCVPKISLVKDVPVRSSPVQLDLGYSDKELQIPDVLERIETAMSRYVNSLEKELYVKYAEFRDSGIERVSFNHQYQRIKKNLDHFLEGGLGLADENYDYQPLELSRSRVLAKPQSIGVALRDIADYLQSGPSLNFVEMAAFEKFEKRIHALIEKYHGLNEADSIQKYPLCSAYHKVLKYLDSCISALDGVERISYSVMQDIKKESEDLQKNYGLLQETFRVWCSEDVEVRMSGSYLDKLSFTGAFPSNQLASINEEFRNNPVGLGELSQLDKFLQQLSPLVKEYSTRVDDILNSRYVSG